jgi:hypothetical protein
MNIKSLSADAAARSYTHNTEAARAHGARAARRGIGAAG